MKLVKSLLLGSAAGLATVAGAQAADLPVRKAAAVEYVQLCPAFGRGFWTIPGTDSCLAISGFARLEIGVSERFSRNQDIVGWRARGRLNFDVRTATAVGPVRAFIRLDARSESGSPFGAAFAAPAAGSTGVGFTRTNIPGVGTSGREVRLEQAYVQWGGLVAGRNTSQFNGGFTRGAGYFIGPRFDDATDTEQLSYTFDLTSGGTGFEVAVSAENALNRRVNATPILLGSGYTTAGGDVVFASSYAGQEFPDFVGRVTYKDTWGSAFIAGAVHQVTDTGLITAGPPAIARPRAEDELGFAVNAGVEVGLPFLSAGSGAFLTAAYADGAVHYAGFSSGRANVGGGGITSGLGFNNVALAPGAFGGQGLPVADAVVVNGELQTTEAFTFAGGLTYFYTPQVRSTVYGSYSFVNFDNNVGLQFAAGPAAGARIGFVDFEEYRIGGNVVYSPVAGLDLGVEVLYTNLNPQGRVVVERPLGGGGVVRDIRDEVDILETRLRISRTF